MTTTVWAAVDLPGFHRWPDAPDHRDYLRARHRHLFRITPEVRVDHRDRDVEFHDLGDLVRAWWGTDLSGRECGALSCEDIAHELGNHLYALGLTVVRVTVSEDGECGATLTYDAEDLPCS